jgi:hypothetical protein
MASNAGGWHCWRAVRAGDFDQPIGSGESSGGG